VSGTFTIPAPAQTEAEQAFCPLLQKAFDLWQAGNHQASLDELEAATPWLGSVSLELAGKFHNQTGLALVGLGQYERAMAKYELAADCFQSYDSTSLLAIVRNNVAWVHLQLGQFAQAHESVDDALLLVDRDDLKADFHDTKAQVFLAENKPESALVESDQALALLAASERVLASCLATRAKIKQPVSLRTDSTSDSMITGTQNPTTRTPKTRRTSGTASVGGGAMLPMLECVREILDGSYELAPALFSLIVAVSDPDGDPIRYSSAWEALRLVIGFMPVGEELLRAEIAKADPVEESSDLPS